MDKINQTLNDLATLFCLEPRVLQELAVKHGILEIRQRQLFSWGVIYVSLMCLMTGWCRHVDRQAKYKQEYGVRVSVNAFSDRLSKLKPDFFKALLQVLEPRLNMIGSPKMRNKLKGLVDNIFVLDSSIIQTNERLVKVFGKASGEGKHSSLKLFLGIHILRDCPVESEIKAGTSSDSQHRSRCKKAILSLKDRAWFKWKSFVEARKQKRFFISRIKKNFNPVIQTVIRGPKSLIGQAFQNVNWSKIANRELTLEVQPQDGTGNLMADSNGQAFLLTVRGKRLDSQWYWYLVELPNQDQLSFDDIHQLYRLRWIVEESFREIKSVTGDSGLRQLYHVNCVLNQLWMMLLTWLILKGFIYRIAEAHRRSPSGFRLDTVMKGQVGKQLIELLLVWLNKPLLSKAALKRLSEDWVNTAYSQARAQSQKKRLAGKALGRVACA